MSPNFFRMLGSGTQVGTAFSSDELDTHEIVLSDRLWHRRYAGDRTIIGRDVRLDGVTYKIAGVTPPGFQHPKLLLMPRRARIDEHPDDALGSRVRCAR
ncbi:MAG: permease [bacterium]|nr:permease [bacterium]